VPDVQEHGFGRDTRQEAADGRGGMLKTPITLFFVSFVLFVVKNSVVSGDSDVARVLPACGE